MTFRSRALLDLARGQECTLQLAGICNRNPETTVSAHDNRGHGMSHKAPDWRVAWLCSACHDYVDGRTTKDSAEYRNELWDTAHALTLDHMFSAGLLTVAGRRPREQQPARSSDKILPRDSGSRRPA